MAGTGQRERTTKNLLLIISLRDFERRMRRARAATRGDLWACEGGLEHEPAWRLGMVKEVDESGLFGLETRAESVSLQGATGRSEVCDRRIAGECLGLLRTSVGDAEASTVLGRDERCGRWTANRCGETLATLMTCVGACGSSLVCQREAGI